MPQVWHIWFASPGKICHTFLSQQVWQSQIVSPGEICHTFHREINQYNQMKLFTCGHCNNPLYFENNACLNCQHAVGFDAEKLSLITLETTGDGQYTDITDTTSTYRLCENAVHSTCNWLVPAAQPGKFCRACALNRTI